MTTDQAMKVKGEERKGNKRRKLGEWDEGDGDDDDDDAAGPEDEWKDKPIMKPDITFFGEFALAHALHITAGLLHGLNRECD